MSSQCQGNALVTFDGINPEDLTLVQCVTDAAGVPIPVDAGFWLNDPVPGDQVVGFVYLLDSSDRDVNMYSVRIVGGHPRLTAEGAVVKAGGSSTTASTSSPTPRAVGPVRRVGLQHRPQGVGPVGPDRAVPDLQR